MIYTQKLITNTIIGNPPACHTFNPVSDSTILEVNKEIDGKKRKYLGYMSNVMGNYIGLYYTDDLNGEWTPYSKNPILSSSESIYRWPSTVYVDGVFHMFLDNNKDSRLERWESKDGINFTFSEILHTENKWWGNYNPFIWLNPNDNNWYLYWRNSTTNEIRVDISKDIRKFRNVQSKIVITKSEALPSFTASPSVLYKDGIYYLLLEGEINKVWKTFLFTSKSPVQGFIRPKEILVNGDACGMHYFYKDKVYLFISNYSGNGWREYTYEVKL